MNYEKKYNISEQEQQRRESRLVQKFVLLLFFFRSIHADSATIYIHFFGDEIYVLKKGEIYVCQ